MGKLRLIFLSILAIQLSRGIEPIIKIEMTSQNRNQDSFQALHLPKYTRVSDDPSHLIKLDPSQLGVMFSHLLGLNPSQNLNWGGVTSSNFLSRPRAISLLTVEGLSEDRGLEPLEGTTYRIERDIGACQWLSGAFNPNLLRSRYVSMVYTGKRNLL